MTTQNTTENTVGVGLAWHESAIGFYDDFRFRADENVDAIRTTALEALIRSSYRAPARKHRRCTNLHHEG